jgi:carboxyl-terminal processing protease
MVLMKRYLRAAVTAALALAAASAPALASPAQDLFDQASFYLGFYYNGPNDNPGFRVLRNKFQGQIDAACSDNKAACPIERALPVIQEMASSFKDPFTALMPARVGDDQNDRLVDGLGPSNARLGLVARPLGAGNLVVLEVFAAESAQKAGLKRGDVILTLNGRVASEERLMALEGGNALINVGVMRQGQSLNFTLTPKVAEKGLMPSSQISNNIAIIRIPDYWTSEGVANKVHELVGKALDADVKGFVLDLRDSDTGLDTEAVAIAAAFVRRPTLTYKTRFRDGVSTLFVKDGVLFGQDEFEDTDPQQELENPQFSKLPVMVLVNNQTINSGEMLAYLLKIDKRATIIGESTGGQLSVSGTSYSLLSGDYVNVSSLRLYDSDRKPFPERIRPDVEVRDDLKALAEGRDVQLDKALELLNTKK